MSDKQFISNLSATYADVRRLDAKKINLKGKNILEYIEESVPTITHSKDTRETITENDLWGQWVETKDDGTIVVHDDWVTNPNSEEEKAWLSNIKAVQNNKAYSEITTDSEGNFIGVVESSVVANIQTEMIKDGSYMFYRTGILDRAPLTSFSGDLSSLINGESMFDGTSLTSFSGNLDSLVYGSAMFYETSLTSFSGDLSRLIDGDYMFQRTPLKSFSGDLSSLVNGNQMFYGTSLTSFEKDLSSLVNASEMFASTPLALFSSNLSSLNNGYCMFDSSALTSFSGDLSRLIEGICMFYNTPLEFFSGDLSSLINGLYMFDSTALTSFTSELSSLVCGADMFTKCKLTPQSVMFIVESIGNVKEEKAKYTNGEIPWVTYDSTTRKYSAPFGFMENGNYVYTYNATNPYNNNTTDTNIISSSSVGQLTLGIAITNDPSTIDQQLQTFAEGCLYDSWEELKQKLANKGWTATFQYGGTDTSITLSEDEQFRGIPVYARLIEVSEEDKDKAKYCTEDGTKYYNIDWGHDVTDYDQYQYFGSLLEACGYFGVIPKKYLEEA